jgi:hypothetical protein
MNECINSSESGALGRAVLGCELRDRRDGGPVLRSREATAPPGLAKTRHVAYPSMGGFRPPQWVDLIGATV